MQDKIESLKQVAEQGLYALIQKVDDLFGSKAALSSSLSWEDQLISHAIFSQKTSIRVFTLDTGRIFPETYSVLNSTRERYHREIEVYFPATEKVQELVTKKGASSFYESLENRKECCFIRKVEPLNRALEGVQVWITGLRAEHSESREGLEIVEWDESRGLIKLNPLIYWTLDEVKEEIKKHNIPYNVLHDRGFVSIGCQPCTRAIQPGDAFRAGRWWWEDKSGKECGLHVK